MRYPPLTERRAWPPLIAVAHGSSDPRAAAAVTDLMALVRKRTGLDARAAFLAHALPSVPDVLEAVYGSHSDDQPERGAPTAVVLPLLLGAAYHSDADLPALLDEATRRLPGLRISYGEPLGPHPALFRALDRRLAEAEGPAAANPATTSVVLAAAGSSRADANAAVARAAATWQRARGWQSVVPGYASAAAPSPGEAVAGLLRAGAARVVVATYLLAPGVFADQVREQSLAAGATVVSAPLGAAPEVAGVLIERYLLAACEAAELRVRYRA